jgi:mono/diheme cytochrome c family protein
MTAVKNNRGDRNQLRQVSKYFALSGLAVLLMISVLSGCGRERPSENPPIHLNPNMDNQEKYKAQSEGDFFADGSTMRTPVPGTVARGQLREDAAYYTGKVEDGEYAENPEEITIQFLKRGRERYDIFCSPCHSRVGDGRGIMVNRGYVPPPTFHQDRIGDMKDGYLFEVISAGVRNMPAYAHQVGVEDRWAVVAYLRALQRSRNATEEDVPVELRGKIKQAGQ